MHYLTPHGRLRAVSQGKGPQTDPCWMSVAGVWWCADLSLELLGLHRGDAEDQQTNTALRDDVREAVAQLDADNGLRAGGAEHGDDVHERVGQPREHGHPLGRLDLRAHVGVL